MKIIVCVDNSGGMIFNNRRQSRDKAVIADIMGDVAGGRLALFEYSMPLFKDYENVFCVSEAAEAGEYPLFVENPENISGVSFDELTVYRWNRDYPHDKAFDCDFSNFSCISVTEFSGNSHEKITKCVYTECENG